MAEHVTLMDRTTNGSGEALNLAQERWTGGNIRRTDTCKIAVQVKGTFDGATVTLEASLDEGSTYSPMVNGEFTEAEVRILDTPVCMIRGTVSSAGAGTDVQVIIR